MKTALAIPLLLGSLASRAASLCVTVAGSGSHSGADWNNALVGTTLPANMARGNNYYLAGGIYGNGFHLQTANSGTAVIGIYAATIASHATDTGWNQAAMATDLGGNPVITTNAWAYDTDYWIVSGQQRINTNYLVWGYPTNYTFWTWNTNIAFATTASYCHYIDLADAKNFNTISLLYLDMQGVGSRTNTASDNGVYVYPACNNFVLASSHIHNTGGNLMQANVGTPGGGSGINYTFTNNYWASNYASHYSGGHSELMSITCSNLIFGNNLCQDIINSGWVDDAASGNPSIANWYLYGNVCWWSPGYQTASNTFMGGGGFVGFFGETVHGNLWVFNNTFYSITNVTGVSQYYSGIQDNTGFSSRKFLNNLWIRCEETGQFPAAGATCDYNTYIGTDNAGDTGTHKYFSAASASTVVFVNTNSPVYDFNLASSATDTSPIDATLGAPYNVDLIGTTRTNNRGAFEYSTSSAGGGQGPQPSPWGMWMTHP